MDEEEYERYLGNFDKKQKKEVEQLWDEGVPVPGCFRTLPQHQE